NHMQNIEQLSLLIICYFGINVVEQTEDVNLFDLRDQIIENYKYNSDYSLDSIIATINQRLVNINKQAIKQDTINDEFQLLNFTPYPEKIIVSNLVTMKFSKVETIISVLASITGKHIHVKTPYLECQIPKYGHRFTGVIPPVVPYPAFCIRKHSNHVLSLTDLLHQEILEQGCYDTIINWIKRKFNILIAGGTGSGKTTLANAILLEIGRIFPATRILIIEDVPELKFNTNYSLSFTVGEFFSMYDALRLTLRFKPERIVMGEIRGAEAYTLLKAWNTGHPGGVATIHANSVHEALYRFENCINDHPGIKVNRQEIGLTINGIIAIQNISIRVNTNLGFANKVTRKVTALRQIVNYDVANNIYQDIVLEYFDNTKEKL
ncbi:MAG: ATPase, T2SS/T4P/T4SS family, partial [Burkholderiales bacterium]|nr:ATPase, T2SS/T4P/T4SS family [Burkholderiales bacterium]